MAKTLLAAHKVIQNKVTIRNYTTDDIQREPWIENVKRMSEGDLKEIEEITNNLQRQLGMTI
jgi:hypothetical protein